ncbi:MAG: calcium-binding protein [Pseudomonadota bacterium]
MPSTPEVWESEFQANTVDSGTSGNDQNDSFVIQLDNGNTVVFYTDNSDASPATQNGLDIVGQIFDPLGNRIGTEFVANGFSIDDESNFDAVALPNGRFVVVYEDNAGGTVSLRATEWSTDASGATAPASKTITSAPGGGDTVSKPSVDAFDDGSYVVAYEHFDLSASDFDTRFKIVDSSGVVGTEQISMSGSSSASADTDVAVLSNGNIAFVYDFDGADDALSYRVHNSSGTPLTTSTFVANTNTNGDTDSDASIVALEGGGFVISWTNNDVNDTDIEFQRYDNAGTALGGVVTVEVGGSTDNNNESHLIALSDGGFVVAYDDDEQNNIAFQRYNSSGTTVGSRVFVTSDANAELDPSGIGLEDGRFIVGWTDRVSGDDDVRIEYYDPRDAPNNPGVYTPDQWVVGTIGNDVFTPASNAEFVHGWDGDDVITESGVTREYYGDAGNDTINVVSSINADRHDGGTGIDTIDWSAATSVIGATFNLVTGTATQGAFSEVMVNFENVNGTGNNDTIIGNSAGNTLNGNDGDDRIEGGLGNDEIDGGAGNDTLLGGFAADTVNGGSGDDLIIIEDGQFIDDVDGGGGVDTLDLSDIVGAGEAVDINDGTFIGLGGARTIASIESILGTQEDDFIRNDSGTDTIDGQGGDDTLQGGFNTDSINGGAGNDLIQVLSGEFFDNVDGGAGNDTLDHSDVTRSGDVFDFLAGQIVTTFATGTPTLANIETYRDGSGSNTIISDGSGAYFGNGGNDLMLAGLGTFETLNGGAGNDTLDTTSFNGNYEVNLATGATNAPPEFFINFENIISGAGEDTLTGTNGANRMEGGAGTDLIMGEAGNDTMDGGTDRDTMEGGLGDDTYFVDDTRDRAVENVGEGEDTVISTADFRLRDNVENLTLDGLAVDDLTGTGNGLDNTIIGDDGDNRLRGRGGSDTIEGGDGEDRVGGGSGADDISGGADNDSLRGESGSDIIDGGSGVDTINGGVGNDDLIGGSGDDIFRFTDNYGRDEIFDFEDGLDRINLRDIREENGGVALDITQLLITQVGADARIELDLDSDGVADAIDLDGDGIADNNRIDVLNTAIADLTAADFVF